MRILLNFSKTDHMRYTGHLDLQHTWERTFRRAGLPLSYSQGFKPHPKINLAAPLPLGFTSEAEVLDARLDQSMPVLEVSQRLSKALPPGLVIHLVQEIDLHASSLQSQVISAEYLVIFLDPVEGLSESIQAFLGKETVERERRGKIYDLRRLVEGITLLEEDQDGHQRFLTRLSSREGATGRPEELILGLGYDPLAVRIHRKKIIFQEQG